MSHATVAPRPRNTPGYVLAAGQAEGFGDPVLVLERQALGATAARPLQLHPDRVKEIASARQALVRQPRPPTPGSRPP